jgi:aspartate racemase
MYSVDFDEIQQMQHEDKWEELNATMADAAKRVELAGAEIVALCTNTMHLCEKEIREAISIPFLHIAEATGHEIRKRGVSRVALFGTRFTMEKDFYKDLLKKKYGVDVIIPDLQDRKIIHNTIYNELVRGEINDISREKFITIIGKLQMQGAQGVILGCTEIPLLISENDVEIPVFDTTTIHAEMAVEWALS